MQFKYRPKGVCSQEIIIDLDGDIVKEIQFVGGCDGNLSGISRLAAGQTVEELARKLTGITCGYKKTSCPDQLSMALRQAVQKAQKTQ